MSCHVCGAEAVGRCYSCGALFCAQHGDENCLRCVTSIMAGDPRADRVTGAPGQAAQRPGWWRPQQAEGYTPPACYRCQGIAQRTCANCGLRYCPEHAGTNGMCAECNQSSWLGLGILVAIAFILGSLVLLGFLQGSD